ncbi:MAG: hypothetical protein BWY95_00540 [Bacteroidetes bacterium ADurb.BinA104]|jgi:hypothetical protein|nr:MAG: hypothetical protein BWY95_00540 [Bacteroidetes bacterium ADurb.BinA104]
MATTVNGITFEEYCGGMSAEDAKEKSLNCPYWRPDGCEASSPGGNVQCLFCRHIRIPDNHPWAAEIKAFKESA